MPRRHRARLKRILHASAAILVLSCAHGLAQPADRIGPPRVLVPQILQAPAGNPPSAPGADTALPESPPERQAPPPRFGRVQSIEVGELGTLEGPVAGTIDDADGGLGSDAWQGANRAAIIALLQSLPASTPSAASRLLLRKAILTTAAPPPGRSDVSFNLRRLTKLKDAALIDDAANLALRIQAPANLEIVRAQADAVLLAGHDAEACGDLTSLRLSSAEPFWVKLRAYCYAVAQDSGALDLTLAVIGDQGTADPAFLTLLDGMVSGKPTVPEVMRFPDSLHVAIMARSKLPMTVEIATRLSFSESLIAARSEETPAALRLAAAERVFRAGALPTPVLAGALDLIKFTPQELAAAPAPALARSEPLMSGLARLRTALRASNTSDAHAELVYTAFDIGAREGLLLQVADLFADEAAAIMPAPDWDARAELMIRGLVLANRADAAERWYDILDRGTEEMAQTADQLQLALALASPGARNEAGAELVLTNLALVVNPPPPEPVLPLEPAVPGQPAFVPPPAPPPPPPLSPELRARATLDFGLFDALGYSLPQEAQVVVERLVSQQSLGRRPPAALMQRIDRAALANARGELALSVVSALGTQGAGDLAPDVVVKLVRALKTAGIADGAEALALEAMALRPRAGATGG